MPRIETAPTHIHRTSRCTRISGLQALVLAAAWTFCLPLFAGSEEFGDKLLMLATGPTGGAFRPIGDSVCGTVNGDRSQTLVRCVAIGTAGSIFNLHAVSAGSMQIGLAQEDLFTQFYTDRARTNGGALRSLMLLHTSPIAVMARGASGIAELQHIAGKKVNLGNRGSGQFAITAALLSALKLKNEDLAAVSYLATSDFAEAFCGGEVDVVVEAVAHPSPLFEKLVACGGKFLDVPEPITKTMIANNPFLAPMTIAAGTYAGQLLPVQTLGMRNVLFTNAAVDEEAVFRLTSTLNARFKALKRDQPLLGSMKPLEFANGMDVAVPLHPGALRALKVASQGAAQ